MKKSVIYMLTILAALMVFAVPSFAVSYGGVDMEYSGEIDIRSGLPASDDNSGTSAGSRVSIGDGAVYDRDTKMYCYSVYGGEVAMNIPSGAVTTSPVSITIPEGMETRLYINGEELTGVDYANIGAVGKYVLRFSDTEEKFLTFTIVGSVTGIITGYQIPAGFTVSSATFNDSPLEASTYVDMSQEGVYAVSYYCAKTGVTHYLNVTIDNTPPVLKLEGVENGYAKGPVDISDLDKDAHIYITLNGDKLKYEDVLTQSGTYDIIVSDDAGNVSSYSFVIGVYFNAAAGVVILVILLLVAGLAVYLILSRRKLRVR